MENNLNYPVKYAVLELKVNRGWDAGYEDVTLGFIVSKCYVVGQNMRYFHNGTSHLSYEMVFPHKDFENFKTRLLGGCQYNKQVNIPTYGYHGDCMNSNVVADVFNTYEDASIIADEQMTI